MITFDTDLWTYLKTQKNRPVVLYGTGDGADKIIKVLDKNGIKVSGIFASPGFVRDRKFHDIQVESFEDCYERYGKDMIVLMCFGSSRDDVLNYVSGISSKCEFYAPDVPVYGDNLFDNAFCEKHQGEIEIVRGMLKDELSRKTFDCIISARLTGNISYLNLCEVSQEEADSILPQDREGLFVDLGAYDGDTVMRYSSLMHNLNGFIAVEPDRRNMRKLKENTCLINNIEYVQAFISDKDGTADVVKNIGRGTSLAKEGDNEVQTVTIDGLVKGRQTAFIKFDVEGAEAAAIAGGAETIKTNKPLMNIACYHRSEDIFELPLKVLKLNPGYKVYMRHTPSIPAWDTVFYFC